MDSKKIWSKTLEEIKSGVGIVNFRGWFSQTELEDINDQKVVLSVPSAFFSDKLKVRYLDIITSSLEKVTGEKLEVEFKIDPSKLIRNKNKQSEEEVFYFMPQIQTQAAILNPKYTMENFVVGLSNNVAFAAAQAVVQNPGTSYNPLFLYGGTGVGKTHLMLGIGNALIKKNPAQKVIYSPSEKFMNDYVDAIKTNRMGDLRNKYRSADVLLVDDIQFFSGREGTQEEFFHTFNDLQNKNSQIILSSDRIPNEIAKLEERLKSRFVGGLMVDIQSPDFDTRVAILKAKCEEKKVILPEDTLNLLASSLETNIRELEGKLMQILQSLEAQNLTPSVENVSKFINTPKAIFKADHKKVITILCNFFDLTQKDLIGPKRQKEFVLPRHIAMFLLCEELNMTVERTGQILGGRDHTTVMHGRDRIKNLINSDREVQRTLIEIKQRLLA